MSASHPITPWRATAHSNIALVKYWGKRPSEIPDLNLPAVSSLSLTLDELRTETTLEPSASDIFVLDGQSLQEGAAKKVFAHLDRVWTALGHSDPRPPCQVESTNHLPTAAGLASSASGFAALTLAAHGAFGGSLDLESISQLARRGSGSAARSIWGGAVRLDRGSKADGSDCRAYPIATPQACENWRFIIVHTAQGPKAIGSTGAMQRCAETSPFYPAWVEGNEADIEVAHKAIEAQDLEALGAVMEHSCYKMHACMWATVPALRYWNGVTLSVLEALEKLRAQGHKAYATSDAGPHVKVLCAASASEELASALARVPGVHQVQVVAIGPHASSGAR